MHEPKPKAPYVHHYCTVFIIRIHDLYCNVKVLKLTKNFSLIFFVEVVHTVLLNKERKLLVTTLEKYVKISKLLWFVTNKNIEITANISKIIVRFVSKVFLLHYKNLHYI